MLKISENNGTEEIGLVTPTPDQLLVVIRWIPASTWFLVGPAFADKQHIRWIQIPVDKIIIV